MEEKNNVIETMKEIYEGADLKEYLDMVLEYHTDNAYVRDDYFPHWQSVFTASVPDPEEGKEDILVARYLCKELPFPYGDTKDFLSGDLLAACDECLGPDAAYIMRTLYDSEGYLRMDLAKRLHLEYARDMVSLFWLEHMKFRYDHDLAHYILQDMFLIDQALPTLALPMYCTLISEKKQEQDFGKFLLGAGWILADHNEKEGVDILISLPELLALGEKS